MTAVGAGRLLFGSIVAGVAFTAAAGIVQFSASRLPVVSANQVKGASTVQPAEVPPLPYVEGTVKIRAANVALAEAGSGQLVFGAAAKEQVPIASTTKLTTALIASRLLDPRLTVTVPKEAARQIGSTMGLRAGERIAVGELLKGALLVSGNDAAFTLGAAAGAYLEGRDPAVPAAEDIPRFVRAMNEQAAVLGMDSTRYEDPAGLGDGWSTAADLTGIMRAVLKDPSLRAVIGTAVDVAYGNGGTVRHDLRNSNRLVADYFYDGVLGGKTGYTPEAGHCLVSAAERGGVTLIGVVLHTGADTKEASADEMRRLLDFGFNSLRWYR